MKNKEQIHLCVIGVHKGGTTSLYKYLGGHPEVFRPLQKELHFFTPRIYNYPIRVSGTYADFFRDATTERYLLDVSPSYFYGTENVLFDLKALGEVKIILLLRNPVSRFVSFYKQGILSGKIQSDETIERFFQRSFDAFQEFQKDGIPKDTFHNRALREGCYSLYLKPWITHFGADFKLIWFESFTEHPKSVMLDLAKWLQINPLEDTYSFTKENESYTPKNSKFSGRVNRFFLKNEKFFRKNVRLKSLLKSIYLKFNKGKEITVSPEVIKALEDFYKPYNTDLFRILDENGLKRPDWKQ